MSPDPHPDSRPRPEPVRRRATRTPRTRTPRDRAERDRAECNRAERNGAERNGAGRNWAEDVVIRSYEGALTDPDQQHADPDQQHAGPEQQQAEPAQIGLPPQPRALPAWLVATALVLACAAVLSAALWWQHRSRVIEVIRRAQVFSPAGPDATGCPIRLPCLVLADIGQPLNTQARRLFPEATVLSSLSAASTATGRTVQTTIVLRTPAGLEVWASAQCVPDAGPIPARAGPLPLVGPAQADLVVAGAPGCSVAVAAQVPQGMPVPLAQLRQLAGDPGVQLSPGG